ncbi:MAG: bifunctional aspartate kinase/homoserine dehydrogenase I [Bacteroides sp.]|nr:bifunctional aspartate kinase/homoserine dehydrogenase I [Bacteroides sp.]
MKVLKFGGSSVGTPAALANVKKIVESTPGRKVIVVSALGGVTDLLLSTAALAKNDDVAYLEQYARIVERHRAVIDAMVPASRRDQVDAVVRVMLEELANIYKGVMLLHDLSTRAQKMIVSYGERMSSVIVASIIEDAELFDSRRFIRTKKGPHHEEILDTELTNELIHKEFSARPWTTAVCGGFLATDSEGEVSNLGRGGSDYTASILAAALDAEILEIWTDVDGFMTADPRVIPHAYVIDRLTFTEAMELCNFGAKVIYPPTIYPVYHKDIPIKVKNTFNPESPGTLISNQAAPSDKVIKGISSINDTALVTISSLCMVGVIGVNSRIFDALTDRGVSVFLVSQAASENNTTIAVRNADVDLAVETLKKEFAVELADGMFNDVKAERDMATVAVVGENMKHCTGIAGKLFNTVGRNGIDVIACAQGAAQTNISFVIDRKSLTKALNVIHDSFFLSETQVLNVFITGVGNVGGSLLHQIEKQQEKLRREKNLKINVVGIASSRKAVFNKEGLDAGRYRQLLEESGFEASPERIVDEVISMNLYNSVFVDCTASHDIASLYGRLLEHNVNVVTANKIAASSAYPSYQRLKHTARQKDVKYLFETNVGAGLPVINTINSLINSGDTILKIEAVVSGTLNYIFDVLSADIPLSKAVDMAREAGYAEPDPRIDLSGTDVVRKIVILAREAGYVVEQSDVEKHLFVPDHLFEGEAEDFISNLKSIDADFEEQRKKEADAGRKFRFVASFDRGRAEVALRSVDSSHPFFNLEGSNNVILLTTERYRRYPMEIKGYGAGAEVTAAGVFADIISIANIR